MQNLAMPKDSFQNNAQESDVERGALLANQDLLYGQESVFQLSPKVTPVRELPHTIFGSAPACIFTLVEIRGSPNLS